MELHVPRKGKIHEARPSGETKNRTDENLIRQDSTGKMQ